MVKHRYHGTWFSVYESPAAMDGAAQKSGSLIDRDRMPVQFLCAQVFGGGVHGYMSKINAKNLLHPYYRLSEAATMLECTEADLLRLAATSRLELITPNLPEQPFTAMAEVLFMDLPTPLVREEFDLLLGTEDSFTFFVVPSLVCASIDLCGSGRFNQFYGAYVLMQHGGLCPTIYDMRDGFLYGDNERIQEILRKQYKGIPVLYSLPQGQYEITVGCLFIRHAELERIQTTEDIAPEVSAGVAPVREWKVKAWQYGQEFHQENERQSVNQIAAKVAQRFETENIKGRGGKPLGAENIRREALIGLKSGQNSPK